MIFKQFRQFIQEVRQQDFGFMMVAAYLVFSYWRPQLIYPVLDIVPWAQLSLLAGLGYAFLSKQFRFQIAHFWMLCFAITVLLSAIAPVYPEISSKNLNVPFIFLLEILLFTNCIKNFQQLKLITIVFLLIMFKMAWFGTRTWISRGFGFVDWGIAGPPGFFANSGEFSLLLAMITVMSMGFLFGFHQKSRLYYLLPLFCVMTILGASSRGGQLAVVIAVVYFLFNLKLINFKVILLGGALSFALWTVFPEEQKQRFSSAGEDKTSTHRLNYWQAGWDMMKEYPYLGVGYNGFPSYFHENYKHLYYEGYALKYAMTKREVSHNSFVQVGSQIGFVGLFFYCVLLIIPWVQNRGARSYLKKQFDSKGPYAWVYYYSIGMDAAMVAFLVGGFFMSVAFYPYIYIMLMTSQTILNLSKGTEAEENE